MPDRFSEWGTATRRTSACASRVRAPEVMAETCWATAAMGSPAETEAMRAKSVTAATVEVESLVRQESPAPSEATAARAATVVPAETADSVV
jgi:hypothetical protein